MTIKVLSSNFIWGSSSIEQLPNRQVPEIAVLGRSNVGKSTFINKLASAKGLARTSSTPGRTKEINLFELKISGHRGEKQSLILADLPGFGFAKTSKQEREALAKLSVDYIQGREPCEIIILLNDSRREPEDDELTIRNLAFENDRRLLVVLTKSDKLKRAQLQRAQAAIARSYGLEAEDLFISGSDTSPDLIWNRIFTLLN